MKKYLFTFLSILFFCSHLLIAQAIIVEYEHKHNRGNTSYDSVVSAVLLFKDSQSKYSYRRLGKGEEAFTMPNREELRKKFQEQGTSIKLDIKAYKDSLGDIIYKNFTTNISKVRLLYSPWPREKGDPKIHEEPLAKIDWKIEKEQKKIGNFTCQKATARFRGRNYTAWFAPEIPVSAGPWKLHGLSGLILEAYDDTQQIKFLFEKIEYPAQNSKVAVIDPQSGKKITFAEYKFYQTKQGSQKLLDEETKKKAALAGSRGGGITGTVTKFDCIEREFEK